MRLGSSAAMRLQLEGPWRSTSSSSLVSSSLVHACLRIALFEPLVHVSGASPSSSPSPCSSALGAASACGVSDQGARGAGSSSSGVRSSSEAGAVVGERVSGAESGPSSRVTAVQGIAES